jgi:hypothetical protein
MFFPVGQGKRFKRYIQAVNKYSGLDAEEWSSFLNNMKVFENSIDKDLDVAAGGLYASLENIRNMGLKLEKSDTSEYQDELDQIAGDLGYEGEVVINQNAIAKGLYFFPKYLNETLKDYTEDVRTDPFPRRRGDQ